MKPYDPLKSAVERRCEGKNRYSPNTAERLAQRQTKKLGELIVPYKCFDCSYWHIGHAPQPQQDEYREYLSKIDTRVEALLLTVEKTTANCGVCNKPIAQTRRIKFAKRGGKLPHQCGKACELIRRNEPKATMEPR